MLIGLLIISYLEKYFINTRIGINSVSFLSQMLGKVTSKKHSILGSQTILGRKK